jgi:hypothetical protein
LAALVLETAQDIVLDIVGTVKNVEIHKVGVPASTKVQHWPRLENNYVGEFTK